MRRKRESNVQISPEAQAIAAAHTAEWEALTDEERAERDEALARAIREAERA